MRTAKALLREFGFESLHLHFKSAIRNPKSAISLIVLFLPTLPPNRAFALSLGPIPAAKRTSADPLDQPGRLDDESPARIHKGRWHRCPSRLQTECSKQSILSRPPSCAPAAGTSARFLPAGDL